MQHSKTMLRVIAAAVLTALAACSAGKPMAFPEPESELNSRPGALTGDGGEWVLYRKQ